MNDVIYAIGDIHGFLEHTKSLLEEIEKDRVANNFSSPKLIFLGDYIDRGMYSKEVVAYLMSDFMPDYEKVFLMGNHEDMMVESFYNPNNFAVRQMWLENGGWNTLHGYAKDINDSANDIIASLPNEHMTWMRDLPFLHEEDDYVFVHGGVMPLIPIEDQQPQDCMWIRTRFLVHPAPCIKKVVHGHTPQISGEPENTPTRINLDTCVFATGVLTAVALHDGQERFLTSKVI